MTNSDGEPTRPGYLSEPAMTVDALHHVISGSPIALVMIDSAGWLTDANTAAASFVGIDNAGALCGRSVFDFVDDPTRTRQLTQDLVTGIFDGFTRKSKLRTLSGELKSVTVWTRRVVTDQGPVVLAGFAVRAPTGAAPLVHPPLADRMALLITDHDWRITDVSLDAGDLLDLKHDELVGTPLLGMFHPLDANEAIDALVKLQIDGDTVSFTARLKARSDWLVARLAVAQLCEHKPPRLACALAVRPTSAAADERPPADVLNDAFGGTFLPEVASAVDRRALLLRDLTATQWQVVVHLLRGHSISEIAGAMYLSKGTVRNYLSALYKKFGVRNQAGLIAAIRGAYHEPVIDRDVPPESGEPS